jgi:hypothetical protein
MPRPRPPRAVLMDQGPAVPFRCIDPVGPFQIRSGVPVPPPLPPPPWLPRFPHSQRPVQTLWPSNNKRNIIQDNKTL